MSSKLPQNNLPVTMLRNLGPKSAVMLAEVGIRTIGELRAIGAAKAYVRVKATVLAVLRSIFFGRWRRDSTGGAGKKFQWKKKRYFSLRSAGFVVERNVRWACKTRFTSPPRISTSAAR